MKSSRSLPSWAATFPAASTSQPPQPRAHDVHQSHSTCRNLGSSTSTRLHRQSPRACWPLPSPAAAPTTSRYPANYREYAYVTNGGSGTVTVLDVVNVRVDREIAVGQNPVAVAASPTRNEVYVVNSGAPGGQGSVSVINAREQHRRRHHSRAPPARLHRARRRRRAGLHRQLRLQHHLRRRPQVSPRNRPHRRRRAARCRPPLLPTARPWSSPIARATPSASSIPQPWRVRASLRRLPRSQRRRHPPRLLQGLHRLLRRPSDHGHRAGPPQLTRPAPTSQPDRLEALLDVGRAPVQLALKPDGGELFVSNSLSESISEVVTSTDDVGGAYMIGDNPVRGLVSARQFHALRRQLPAPNTSPSTPSTTAGASTRSTSATAPRRWHFPPPVTCSLSSIPVPTM